MANNYGIPEWLEQKVKIRDTRCVYCLVPLKAHAHVKGTPSDKATFEHIDNDGPPSEENIALCCAACNASKGVKTVSEWFNTDYCRKKNISGATVAPVVREFINTGRKQPIG